MWVDVTAPSGRARRPRAAQLVGVQGLWDFTLTEQTCEEVSGGWRIPVGLNQDVNDGTVRVDGPPGPALLSTDLDVHLVQESPGTPAEFPVAQVLRQQGSERDVPWPHRVVTDHDSTLLQSSSRWLRAKR